MLLTEPEPEMDGMDNLAGGGGSPHDRSMEARVAVLEEIAAATKQGIVDIRNEIREQRSATDRRLDATNQRIDALRDSLKDALERDFRIMFGALITAVVGLAALMAKGFHWF